MAFLKDIVGAVLAGTYLITLAFQSEWKNLNRWLDRQVREADTPRPLSGESK